MVPHPPLVPSLAPFPSTVARVNTFHYLADPTLAPIYWPSVVAGLAIAALGGALSALVVLKRLAFIGQGISHAAFGGVGVAAILGLTAASGEPSSARAIGQLLVVLAFCLLAAGVIGWLSHQRSGRELEHDTAIGVVLVASMAAGALLLKAARSTQAWESFLFGSILGVTWPDAALAWAAAIVTASILWFVRRPLLFWAFDAPVARANGVSANAMNTVLLLLLAIATVTAMKLAGVVLATAMLVLPGAIALQCSRRLVPVLAITLASAGLGVVAGLVLCFELDWLPGPSIVLVLAAMLAATPLVHRLGGGLGAPALTTEGARP